MQIQEVPGRIPAWRSNISYSNHTPIVPGFLAKKATKMHQHSLNLKNITNPSVRGFLMAKRSGADDLFLGASLPPK